MKLVCILYDDMYDEADIIAVPDSLYDNIQELGQQFQWWLGEAEHDFWITRPNGQRVLAVGTAEFVWWLNKQLGDDHNEKVKIVEENVRYRRKLKTIHW